MFPIKCGIVRNAIWLNWKLHFHTVLEFREPSSNQLLGYIALKKDGLIVDMLARTKSDAEKMIASAINNLHHSNPDRFPTFFSSIKVMYTPVFEPLLQNKNFEKSNFSFAFGSYPISNAIKRNQIKSLDWYMMPND
jgi:hypothetical protein